MAIENVAKAVFRGWGLVVDLVSRASIVKLDVTLRLVGLPVIDPVALSSFRPRGSAPDTSLHVYGGLPPLAMSC
jgi:hypothetical protein